MSHAAQEVAETGMHVLQNAQVMEVSNTVIYVMTMSAHHVQHMMIPAQCAIYLETLPYPAQTASAI